MGDGGGGHCLVRMEWHPAGWSVYLPLLIFPCTIKSRSSVLAPAHPGGPRKRAVKRLWYSFTYLAGLPSVSCSTSSKKELLGHTSSLSPNQQCQNTKGTRSTNSKQWPDFILFYPPLDALRYEHRSLRVSYLKPVSDFTASQISVC